MIYQINLVVVMILILHSHLVKFFPTKNLNIFIEIVNVIIGKVSGHEYYFAQNSAGTNTYITRRDANFINQWETSFSVGFTILSVDVNNAETRVYMALDCKSCLFLEQV